ncbi:MAG: AAA family ATPase [Dehalococcoidales bacterium]|nr:AAA family ATPase [Dehalococcoidales bacterium]
MKIVALVGMAGAGKSEAARLFSENGFTRIRFGDKTDEELNNQGLAINEENERRIREQFRKQYGMAAYAVINLSRIELTNKTSPVIIDGLYSWEEYTFLKNYFKDNFYVVAVWASPQTRYARLKKRAIRPLMPQEAANRDEAEILKVNKGGPIAMADFTIINESSFGFLKKEVKKAISFLRRKN